MVQCDTHQNKNTAKNTDQKYTCKEINLKIGNWKMKIGMCNSEVENIVI